MAWCFEGEGDSYALHVLDRLGEAQAIVPSIWLLEVANVLLVGERRKRLTRANSAQFLTLLRSLPIVVEADAAERTVDADMALARETGLSAYDAVYLGLATRQGLPLATSDAKMKRAARKCGAQVLAKS